MAIELSFVFQRSLLVRSWLFCILYFGCLVGFGACLELLGRIQRRTFYIGSLRAKLKTWQVLSTNNQFPTKTLVSLKDDSIKIKFALIMPIVITLKTMAYITSPWLHSSVVAH